MHFKKIKIKKDQYIDTKHYKKKKPVVCHFPYRWIWKHDLKLKIWKIYILRENDVFK